MLHDILVTVETLGSAVGEVEGYGVDTHVLDAAAVIPEEFVEGVLRRGARCYGAHAAHGADGAVELVFLHTSFGVVGGNIEFEHRDGAVEAVVEVELDAEHVLGMGGLEVEDEYLVAVEPPLSLLYITLLLYVGEGNGVGKEDSLHGVGKGR